MALCLILKAFLSAKTNIVRYRYIIFITQSFKKYKNEFRFFFRLYYARMLIFKSYLSIFLLFKVSRLFYLYSYNIAVHFDPLIFLDPNQHDPNQHKICVSERDFQFLGVFYLYNFQVMGKILQKKLLSFFYLKICGEMTNLANNNKTKGFFEKLLI